MPRRDLAQFHRCDLAHSGYPHQPDGHGMRPHRTALRVAVGSQLAALSYLPRDQPTNLASARASMINLRAVSASCGGQISHSEQGSPVLVLNHEAASAVAEWASCVVWTGPIVQAIARPVLSPTVRRR